MKTRNPSRAGFTLVELSIVLVIIGLIIGGVLTGQQIIQSARITNALNGIQAYEAQFQTYAQNYGALPGDDPAAASRFPGATSGSGQGYISGTFDSQNSTDESRLAWADLRYAGLVKNQITTGNSTAIQPPNPFNGIYGFQNGAFSGSGNAFTTTVLCLNGVPGTAAQAIDTQLDDGQPNSGNIMAMVATPSQIGVAVNGTPATSYIAGQTYTMCIKM